MDIILLIFIAASAWVVVWRIYMVERNQTVLEGMIKEIKNLLLTEQASVKVVHKEAKEEKSPAANRRPRTDAEKERASKIRKEWWDKKKALDSIRPSNAVVSLPKEQRIPLADAIYRELDG